MSGTDQHEPTGRGLHVRGLTARYGPVLALDDVDVTAPPGRVTAVLGANGAGKTTLLRTVSGLLPAQAGRVHLGTDVGDVDLTDVSAEEVARAGIAHVPEGRGVIPDLTVEENLRLGALLGAVRSTRRTPPTIADVLTLFPSLERRRKQAAHSLSGGERQMLVIGRALLSAPEVLLLDEPSLGLAPRVVSRIFAVLRELVDTEGLAILLVEQNARSALSIADTGVVLNLGRVVARADAAVLAEDDDLRHAYLGL
ncbi:ABC transporter ATP-binding protein [Saccharomonospora sp. NB11]|jgi:branched-chain amino acid transport system ATP-binding protein|uniref:ABC transporter ATP-binding protein n=1 Tax=Saccharomonospora sp. NB11 TaxID=1642298 RepID=UPI0018D1D978|nr:ABC transporter ATP-binding protein [Saccharomonospora sp. NB11]